MKQFKFFGIIVMLLLAGLVTSCNQNEAELTYTVYTDSNTYSSVQASGITINDGYYVKMDLDSEQWKQISASLTDEYKHKWTKEKINDWFIGRGFGDTEARQETSWITTVNHGMLMSRSGNTVYLILK